MPNSQTQSPDSALFNDIPFDPVEAHRVIVNRENARKSTGPCTESGKARSSQNALKHGLCAQAGSIAATMPGDFEKTLEAFNKDFRPSGVHEEMLVRELALADWRLRIIARIESGFLGLSMQAICVEDGIEGGVDECEDHDVSALMGIAWFKNQNLVALLVRYQNQARRAYYRALKELGLVRSGKADYLPQAPETKSAENETKPPEQAKAAAAAAGNETKPNSGAGIAQTNPRPRTFTVTSRVLTPETDVPTNSDPSRTAKQSD